MKRSKCEKVIVLKNPGHNLSGCFAVNNDEDEYKKMYIQCVYVPDPCSKLLVTCGRGVIT